MWLVDSGRLFFRADTEGTSASALTKAEIIGRTYRKMKFAAVNIGELDLLQGVAFLRKEVAAGVPLISANLIDQAKKTTVFPPYVVKESRGIKVAFLGLMTSDLPPAAQKALEQGFTIRDPLATAQKLMPALRKKADLIVVLSDLGLEMDRKIAKEVKGIHFILGGREAHFSRGPLWEGQTAIFQSFREGMFWGRLNLTIEKMPGSFLDEGRPDLINELLRNVENHLQRLLSLPLQTDKPNPQVEKNIQNLKHRQLLLQEELRQAKAAPQRGNRLRWSMIPMELSLPEDQETADWIRQAGINKN